MRQPTTAEVRLDEHNAASFGPAGPSILPFWLSTSRLRSNFVAAEPPGTEDRDQQLRYPGNVGQHEKREWTSEDVIPDSAAAGGYVCARTASRCGGGATSVNAIRNI